MSFNRLHLIGILLFAWLLNATVAEAQTHSDSATIQVTEVEQRLASLQRVYADLRHERESLEQQFSVLRGSRMLHVILQEARADLRDIRAQDYEEALAQLRLDLYHEQRELRQLAQEDSQRAQVQQRIEELDYQVRLLVEFMQTQQLLLTEFREFEYVLVEYLFWTPSNRRMDAVWWRTLPTQFADQVARIQRSLSQLHSQVSVQFTPLLVILLAVLGLLILKRKTIQQRLRRLDADVLSIRASSPWLIPQALSLHALLVLPTALLVLIAAQCINAPVGAGIDLDDALNAVAGTLFVVTFLWRILTPGGFAELYFNWQKYASDALRHFILWFGWVLVPLSFILAVSSQQTTQIGADVIGQLLVCVVSVYLLALVVQLFRKLPFIYTSKATHRVIGAALLALPLTLLVMCANGYFYTTLMLSGYYLATFYVITAWVLTEASVQRGLDFAYGRMQEQRLQQTALRQATLDMAIDEEGELDSSSRTSSNNAEHEAQAAKLQSKRLARFGLFILFAFILYQIWSEATSALDYLDTQLLWVDPETGTGGLSLGGLVTAVVIAIVGVVLVKNLPGLLELTILSRLSLQMGTAYAVTSLVNYVIISVAVIAFLAALGVRWDQLQWLAAGLTVGLGFGLQEIFGNFISGLILFFERPLRVGDVVTLNTLTGRVAKIRIRATVITDSDRRDILVPNRQFITGQFINWTLSNTVTRITVNVGVAYGSDLDKTKQILTQIALDEPRVLKEPAPTVLFVNFGSSTLDHELRMHVASLADRTTVVDTINREIDRRFKAAGIELAFNQIDVHFRNELGIERRIDYPNEHPNEQPNDRHSDSR